MKKNLEITVFQELREEKVPTGYKLVCGFILCVLCVTVGKMFLKVDSKSAKRTKAKGAGGGGGNKKKHMQKWIVQNLAK